MLSLGQIICGPDVPGLLCILPPCFTFTVLVSTKHPFGVAFLSPPLLIWCVISRQCVACSREPVMRLSSPVGVGGSSRGLRGLLGNMRPAAAAILLFGSFLSLHHSCPWKCLLRSCQKAALAWPEISDRERHPSSSRQWKLLTSHVPCAPHSLLTSFTRTLRSLTSFRVGFPRLTSHHSEKWLILYLWSTCQGFQTFLWMLQNLPR